MKQQKKITKQKGITLISLVITIVIMLILAGVAVSITLQGEGDLFGHAKNATEQWEAKVTEEQTAINEWLNHEMFTGIKQTTDEDATTIAQKDENTYLIQSIEDLVLLSKTVNSGTTYEGKTFEFETGLSFTQEKSYVDPTAVNFAGLGDINGNGTNEALMVELTTGKGFIPIGKYEDFTTCEFKGSIEGNNNVLDGLYVYNRVYAGLIGRSANITIKNLTLTKVNVKTTEGSGDTYAGAFIAYNREQAVLENLKCDGTIEGKYAAGMLAYDYVKSVTNTIALNIKKCSNIAKIIGKSQSAGLIGTVYNVNGVNIENCENKAEVQGYAGILGYTYYTNNINFINCKNTGKIEGTFAGGIAGQLECIGKEGSVIVKNCSNEGEIVGSAGIIAKIKSGASEDDSLTVTIDDCYNSGNLTVGTYSGGIVGEFNYIPNTTITDTYNTGKITIPDIEPGSYGNSNYIGGIIGRATYNTTIENCYNTGDITGPISTTGGIVGSYATTITSGLMIKECYNIGNIMSNMSSSSKLGGICGDANYQTIMERCYNTGDIGGTSITMSGGICGSFAYSILDYYNSGDITGGNGIGGILGYASSSTVNRVYNRGKITGASSYRGGIVGNDATISNAFNFGAIDDKGNSSSVGSIAGSKKSETNCYYLEGTYSVGVYHSSNPDNSGVRSQTEITTLMNSTLTSPTWEAGEDGYPVLSCFSTAE